MSDFTCSTQNQTSVLRRLLHGLFYLALFVPAALIILFFRKLPVIIRFFGDLLPPSGNGDEQIRREIPPRSIPSLLDRDQVAMAAANTHHSVTHRIRPVVSLRPRQADSSDSDWSGSSSSDDERSHHHQTDQHQHLWYAPIQSLEAGDVCLFVSGAIEQLQELVRGLTDAELRRRAFRDAREANGVYRLSDVRENPWILQTGTETFAGPYELTNESTRTWVMKCKITTKLALLTHKELHGQNWQLCEELKEECFAEVAGQSLEKLLEVACSFSDARWSDGHISQQLTIFDALVDVLFNIRDLLFNRFGEVARMVNKMVNAFEGVIQGTTNDIHNSKESTIHPATFVLEEALEFFYHNRDMVKSILETGDYNTDPESDLLDCWVSKLKEDAEIMFQEKGRRYIFVLNNTYYVWQMKYCPGLLIHNVVSNLESLTEQCITSYLGEYWFPPMLSYLDGDSLNKPHRSSLDKFTEVLFSICGPQMTWKVRTELKKTLREEIVKLIVPKYEMFSEALQANKCSRSRPFLNWMLQTSSEKPAYTAAQVAQVITELFER